MIANLAWVLPRPRKNNKYLGGFPEHFETRVLELLGVKLDALILHPFGGRAEYGIRVDIKGVTSPDVIGDAQCLPLKDSIFDLVILDPPYSSDDAKRLYGTKKPSFKRYTAEAVRVLKEGGLLVMYHDIATPAIRGTRLIRRVFIESRMWHKLRCVHIHRKDTSAWRGIRGQASMELKI